ncbi:MAG: hypothetical protein CMM26_05890 [Rhodospirillaceae bacterium]|nr:hypothetical protein [Rhodospirillaceae bacterium]
MNEVLRADWFDLADNKRDSHRVWLHSEFLPALMATQGVTWVGHYDIIPHPDRPYIEGAPTRRETSDPDVPTGWQNVVLTASLSTDVFLGPDNEVNALHSANAAGLGAWCNHRLCVFIEEKRVNGPEERAMPYGVGPPPAMQIGSFNANTTQHNEMLARWYRAERFPRIAVSRGIIRGRKMLSVIGWAKHGVLWEGVELGADDYSFETRFVEADRGEGWAGPHVLDYVTHAPGSPHAGRRAWPKT